MRRPALLALLALAVLVHGTVGAADKRRKKKKDQEPPTQVLQLPKELPGAVVAEAEHMVFHVAPLSARGLLSQQVRDGLKALDRLTAGATLVKLRAFVAGTGDMRRVQQIVSDTFADRRLPLPALSVVQVGGLPLEGAQLALESVSVARRPANPHGLAFFAGQQVVWETPTFQMAPLADKSMAQLRAALEANSLAGDDVVRVTCLLTSLDDVGEIRARLAREFPKAAATLVQLQREPRRSLAECEAVARLSATPDKPVRFVNPPGLAASPNYSQVAEVGPVKLALSGTQMAFGFQDADARLAFQRTEKALQGVRSSLANTVWTSFYPLSAPIAEMIRRVRFDFLNKAAPPAATMAPFEGLPSLDASFAVDLIALVPEPRE